MRRLQNIRQAVPSYESLPPRVGKTIVGAEIVSHRGEGLAARDLGVHTLWFVPVVAADVGLHLAVLVSCEAFQACAPEAFTAVSVLDTQSSRRMRPNIII